MNVTVARIYVTEGEHVYEKIFKRLHDEHKVNGVTVFRGISGFGRSGDHRFYWMSLLIYRW